MGFYAIAKYLNNEGIVSRYKKEWCIRSVKLLLQNPVYKGTFVWNRRDGARKIEKRNHKRSGLYWKIHCLPLWIKNVGKKPKTKT